MALRPEHPKWDQNPKFTPLSETTSIPTPFIWGVPPGYALSGIVHTAKQRDHTMRQVVAYKRVKTIETNKTASSGHRRL